MTASGVPSVHDEDEATGHVCDEDLMWLQEQLAANEIQEDDWEDPTEGKVLTRLFAAVEDNEVSTTRELLDQLPESCSIDTIGPEGDTLLHLACLYDHEECARLLIDRGASVSVRDEDESTCLHDAAASGAMAIVQLLVEKDASLLSAVDNDGDTPLHNAARGNNLDVTQFLLARGADPTAKNQAGQTPREASGSEIEEAVRQVLEEAEKTYTSALASMD